MYNIEEFDPDPFMEALNQFGLPWIEKFPSAVGKIEFIKKYISIFDWQVLYNYPIQKMNIIV